MVSKSPAEVRRKERHCGGRFRFRALPWPPGAVVIPGGPLSCSAVVTLAGTRRCARPDCARVAGASLTYDYGAKTVWIDHLDRPDPSQYDLCDWHAARITVPAGWDLIERRP